MASQKPPTAAKTPVGGYVLSDKPIEINAGRPTVTIKVRNTGDRPIQVGSHFHFFEVNRALNLTESRVWPTPGYSGFDRPALRAGR